MPKLPERWNAYTSVGDVIPGTRFIAFKVPLKETYFSGDASKDRLRFTPSDLVDQLGHKIGLVIDLTATTRHTYYDPQELQRRGVNYKKILTRGHVIPTVDVINNFAAAVENFEKSAEKDKFIGVHCTHGVNRTGYVICRYMIEYMKFSAGDAMQAFERGRGHPIEREHYINSLYQLERPSGNQGNTRCNVSTGRFQHFRAERGHRADPYHPYHNNVNREFYNYQEEPYMSRHPQQYNGYYNQREDQQGYGYYQNYQCGVYPQNRDNRPNVPSGHGRNNLKVPHHRNNSRYAWTNPTGRHTHFDNI